MDNLKAEAVKDYNSAIKFTKDFINNANKAVVSFVKDTKAKITMKNIKDAGKSAIETAKRLPIKKAATVASVFAGITTIGAASDVVANKISAHKADKV